MHKLTAAPNYRNETVNAAPKMKYMKHHMISIIIHIRDRMSLLAGLYVHVR